MPFSFAEVGAETRQERVWWTSIWMEFCKLKGWNHQDIDFQDPKKILEWDQYKDRLLAMGLGGTGMSAEYLRKHATRLGAAAAEATLREALEWARKRDEREKQTQSSWESYRTKQEQKINRKPPGFGARHQALLALGLAPDATPDQIKKSYKRLVMIHHPDRGGSQSEFKKIQDAYDLLLPDKKV